MLQIHILFSFLTFNLTFNKIQKSMKTIAMRSELYIRRELDSEPEDLVNNLALPMIFLLSP